jgi:hypothetical protein
LSQNDEEESEANVDGLDETVEDESEGHGMVENANG